MPVADLGSTSPGIKGFGPEPGAERALRKLLAAIVAQAAVHFTVEPVGVAFLAGDTAEGTFIAVFAGKSATFVSDCNFVASSSWLDARFAVGRGCGLGPLVPWPGVPLGFQSSHSCSLHLSPLW